jgi:thioredoxin 1
MTSIEDLKDFGIEITEDMKEGRVIIDIFTQWCGPCKFLSPTLEKLEKEGLFKLIQVDLDQNRPLGEKFGVTAIPTLLFFKNGKLVDGVVEVQGRAVMANGKMIGNYGEAIIKETISKLS